MTGSTRKLVRLTGALAVLLALVACGGGKSSRFYRLAPVEPVSGFDPIVLPNEVVLVDPLVVADYLKRPQIVTAVDEHELALDEYHRWAEPITRNVESVIRTNLKSRLGTPAVLFSPYIRPSAANFRIALRIDRLDVDANGHCVLDATWAFGVGGATPQDLVRMSEGRRFERDLEGEQKKDDYTARVSAMSALIGELCDAIAETARVSLGRR